MVHVVPAKNGASAATYLIRSWNAEREKNEGSPALFDKLSKFDLTRGITPEQLLYATCEIGAFHVIKVNLTL